MAKEGWKISKADPKVWMRRNGDVHEHVGSCVDDLIVAAKDPKAFFASLRDNYKLRLKGDAPLRCHLGCNFGRDPDVTLCSSKFWQLQHHSEVDPRHGWLHWCLKDELEELDLLRAQPGSV